MGTSEPKPKRSSMTLEELDHSPGNTLKNNKRLLNNILSPPVSPTGRDESPQPVVELLTESPGNRNRRRNTTGEPREPTHTNGHKFASSSQPTSSEMLHDRPSSRQSGVEIVITGRTR